MKRVIGKVAALCSLILALIFSTLIGVCDLSAQTSQGRDVSYYKGKLVKLMVMAEPGEQFDRWARVLAPALRKQLPGSTVIVDNVPGGGRKIGTNKLYKAEPDGLTLGILYRASLISQVLKEDGVNYDFSKFTWLGNISAEPRYLVVAANSPYKTVADIAKDPNFKFGATGKGSFDYYDCNLLIKILSLKNAKLAVGFSSSSDVLMSILKHEVQGYMSIGDLARSLDKNDYRLIMEEAAVKGSDFPEMQNLNEIAPASAKPYLDYISGLYYIAKPVCAPPNLPADLTKILSNALEKATQDPDFLVLAKKNKFNVKYTSGKVLSGYVNKMIANSSPELIKLMKK